MPSTRHDATDENPARDRIRVGLAGFGVSGRYFHYPFITGNPRFQLSTILTTREVDGGLAKDIKRVTSFDALLADPDLDLIVVATPNQFHVTHAESALLAGKHVIVEKPVALLGAELNRLETVAMQANRMLVPFQNRRWDGDFITMQDIINSSVLGSIQRIESSWPIYKGDVTPRASWKKDSSQLNSALYELGSHMVDQVLCVIGSPETVYCQASLDIDGILSRHAFTLDLYYASGIEVRLDVDLTRAALKPRYLVVGTQGEFEKHGLDPQEDALKLGTLPGDTNYGKEPPEMWGEIRLVRPDGQRSFEKRPTIRGNYDDFYNLVFSAIIDHQQPPVKLSEVASQVKILEAATRSALTGQPVAVAL